MKIYYFDELMNKTIDQLLDLLSTYINLRNETCNLIKEDQNMKEFYIENNLYFYLLNIAKIKSTLIHKL